MDAADWEWKPLVAVGPIKFGSDPAVLTSVAGMRLENLERSDGRLWSHYWSDAGSFGAMCLDGRVVSVACHERFEFQSVNLVGLSEAVVRMRFRDHRPSVGEFPDGHTLEFAELGLELTFRDGVVLIASAFDEPLAPVEIL